MFQQQKDKYVIIGTIMPTALQNPCYMSVIFKNNSLNYKG